MVRLKRDAPEIRTVMESLREQDWLRRGERKSWPMFVFHYTDIQNAVNILKDGCLYSRTLAEQTGRLRVTSGSPEILASTPLPARDCVRLYFRPKTPTQYHCEGIMSKTALAHARYPGAHCPVPVFFLFDSVAVLSRADSSFSDGSLRWGPTPYSTAEALAKLPWKKIYHNTSHDPSRRDITYHRNAEVIVPQKLELDTLQYIMCRSPAEKDTLLHLLPREVWLKYYRNTLATQKVSLYYRKHTFVQTARLSSQEASFAFSTDTTSPGPFHLCAEFLDETGHRTVFDETEYLANATLRVRLPRPLQQYEVNLRLDDEHLAYAGRYEDRDISF